MSRVFKTRYFTRQRTLKLAPPGSKRPTASEATAFWLTRGMKPLLWKLRWWKFRHPWMPALLFGAIALGLAAGYLGYDRLPSHAELEAAWQGWFGPGAATNAAPPEVVRGGASRRP